MAKRKKTDGKSRRQTRARRKADERSRPQKKNRAKFAPKPAKRSAACGLFCALSRRSKAGRRRSRHPVRGSAGGKFFDSACAIYANPQSIAKWIMSELLRAQKDRPLSELPLGPVQLAELAKLVDEGEISTSAGKTVFAALMSEGGSPKALVDKLGLHKVADQGRARTDCGQSFGRQRGQRGALQEGKKNAARNVCRTGSESNGWQCRPDAGPQTDHRPHRRMIAIPTRLLSAHCSFPLLGSRWPSPLPFELFFRPASGPIKTLRSAHCPQAVFFLFWGLSHSPFAVRLLRGRGVLMDALGHDAEVFKRRQTFSSAAASPSICGRSVTSTLPIRSRFCSLRVSSTCTSDLKPDSLAPFLDMQNTRLADRQLPIAAAKIRDGLGAVSLPKRRWFIHV